MEMICIKCCKRGSKFGTEKRIAVMRLQIIKGKAKDMFIYR